jgi:3-oxoadipate enol-lactonase
VVLPYDEAGSGDALVLLHAGIADRTMWSEHLEPFAAAGFRVVAPDLPAFGQAPMPEGLDAPWTDVVETLDALGIQSAAFVGNSFGGAVALRVAVVEPGRVSRLVLVSAPPPDLDPSPQLRAIWDDEETALERGDIDAAVDAIVEGWTLPDGPPGVRERVAAMQRRAFETQTAADPPPEADDPLESDPGAIERLEIPVLVAVGERDVPDFIAGAESMAQAIPNARHVVIPGAGHLAPLEQPEAFRRLVLEFL